MGKPIKILIIGNGFGGTYALKNLHKFFHKDPNVELSLIGDKNYFLFTPLLHEVATGAINPANIVEPIRKVLGCCLKNFYLGKAEMINQGDQTVTVGEYIIPYDYLIVAPGAETNYYNIPGAAEYCFPLKSIEDAIKIKDKAIMAMEKASHMETSAERKNLLRFTVIGGGPTGVELAAELHELIKDTFARYYSCDVVSDASIALIQREAELIPQFGKKMRDKSLKVLRKKGIEVMLQATVKEVTEKTILLADNTSVNTEMAIWTAGVKPQNIEFKDPVERWKDGRIMVNTFLQIEKYKEIFVLGDGAAFTQNNAMLPGLAQVAEKQAKAVAENVNSMIRNKILKPFSYSHTGNMLSLGQWMAVGEIYNFTISGSITWWIWRTVYLSKLISFRKKVRVAADWTMNIFSTRDMSL